MFCGLSNNQQWLEAKAQIQKRFAWGEWETGDFIQCGVRVQAQEDGSFHLDQAKYLEEVQPINVSKDRRRTPKEETRLKRKLKLRGLLGALSWHTNQIGYRFAAYTGLFLSEVNKSTVETLLDVNQLLDKIKGASHEPLKILPFSDQDKPQLYCWTDASSQNRHDGGSTKGIFVAMSGEKLEHLTKCPPGFGKAEKSIVFAGHLGSAEARAAVDGDDILHMLRFQWGEVIGCEANVHDIDAHASKVGGVLITDSRRCST